MDYRYEGNFRTDETGYCDYRPAAAAGCFYCCIYPGSENTETGIFGYGCQCIRARIVPYSGRSVEIAGWEGVFDILPYSSGYAVLDNARSGGKPRRKALIAVDEIRKHFLEIKEE